MSAVQARSIYVRHVDEESLVALDLQVAIHRDIEGITLLTRWDCLSSQNARLIIIVSHGRGAILSCEAESYATFRRRLVEAHDEGEDRRAGVAFIQAHIIN